MRACALESQLRQAVPIGDEPACEFPVLAIEEVFVGKTRAMIDRKHPRGLYDLFRFRKANLSYDCEVMRKLAVLFSSTLNRDLRTYNISRSADIDEEAIKRGLYPLLKAGDRPTGPCSRLPSQSWKVFWIIRARLIFSKQWQRENISLNFYSPKTLVL